MASITATNAIVMLAIFPIFPAPQRLVGFSADAAFDTEAVDIAEIVLGVDGRLSAGYVPYVIKQTYSIMPDSPTSLMFETWASAEKIAQDKFFASATIVLPATSRKYTLTRGVLTSYMAVPNAKKVLEMRAFMITWGDISPASF